MALNDRAFENRIEWLEADGVTSPELRETWARFEWWIGGRCVTQVEGADATLRRSVTLSLYPFAEWIAENWWSLLHEVRVSGHDERAWGWRNVGREPWLRRHNVRGAGDGMPWPDLTVVPEGSITRFRWRPDDGLGIRRVAFVGQGDAAISSEDAVRGLGELVEAVLARLSEQGIKRTALHEEWAVLRSTDGDEADFCAAAARLGLDPYSVEEAVGERIVEAATALPEELHDDFFNAVLPHELGAASRRVGPSTQTALRLAAGAPRSLEELRAFASGRRGDSPAAAWSQGYAFADALNEAMQRDLMQPFDLSPWVRTSTSSSAPHGIQGLGVSAASGGCGLVVPKTVRTAREFWSAKALGLALFGPREHFILSRTRSDEERMAGAFAAELLAPARGIQRYLQPLGPFDDAAAEAIAARYGVSPLLVRHQHDNRLQPAA
jgi:hypothetical protein